MTNHDPDRWLDSITPGELDRADAADTARSVERVLRALGRTDAEPLTAPPRRAQPASGRSWWAFMGIAVGVATGVAAAALGLLSPALRQVEPPAPPSSAQEAPAPPAVAQTPAIAPELPVAPPGPVERPGRPAPRAPERAPTPPSVVAQASSQAFGAGLTRFDDTRVEHIGADAVLTRGSLRFLRDADHDPGVSRVVIRDLPLVIDPVGTEFVVGACPGGAAVIVQHGRVFLRRADGEPLAEVREGESTLILADPAADGGLALESIASRGLDGVSAAAAAHAGAQTTDVLAMVARLRLISLGDAPVQELLKTNP